MTNHTHALAPDIVAVIVSEAALTDEAKVQSLATALVLEEGGPMAGELMAVPMPESDPCSWAEIQDAVASRRALLHGTEQWHAAERLLADTRPA